MINAWCDFRPQTPIEAELLADCSSRATMHGCPVADVLADAARFWTGAGRSMHPRQWRSRAAAAERLIARGQLIAECATAGIDPFVEIDGLARMSAEELRDQITYLADHQG